MLISTSLTNPSALEAEEVVEGEVEAVVLMLLRKQKHKRRRKEQTINATA